MNVSPQIDIDRTFKQTTNSENRNYSLFNFYDEHSHTFLSSESNFS